MRLLHTHGKAEQTVPILGRGIMPDFVQGIVYEMMEIRRVTNGCATTDADRTDGLSNYSVQRWKTCLPGTDLDFALHEGGHSIPKGWAKLAMDRFGDRWARLRRRSGPVC